MGGRPDGWTDGWLAACAVKDERTLRRRRNGLGLMDIVKSFPYSRASKELHLNTICTGNQN